MLRVLAGVSALLLMVACPGGGPTPDESPSPTAEVSPTPLESPSPLEERALAGAECAPSAGGTEDLAFLSAVRVGTHSHYDRVTFEFTPAGDRPPVVPRFTLETTVPPIREDASGRVVEVDGEDFVQIVLHGATGVDLSGEEPREVYTGERELAPGFPVLQEVQETGDFEATMSWVLGLNRRSCWAAFSLQDPPRLVVDLPH